MDFAVDGISKISQCSVTKLAGIGFLFYIVLRILRLVNIQYLLKNTKIIHMIYPG